MTHTSTEQPELLPCPLCGGDVKHEVWSDRNYHKVECQDCGLDVDYCNSYAELSAFWNRRTPVAQAQRVPLSEPITHAAHRPTWDGQTFSMTQIKPMHDIKIEQLHAHWEQHKEFGDVPFTAGVRYAERAHGITQEKQG